MPVSIRKILTMDGYGENTKTPSMEWWDNDWGYYIFSQTVSFNYGETKRLGVSSASIVINGKFTIAAANEASNSGSLSGMGDSARFDKLMKRYNNLRNKIIKCTRSFPPKTISDIGTINDKRCIALPDKLLNDKDEIIYAIPVSFSVYELSPNMISYSATLNEPEKITCKLSINDTIIDGSSLTVVARKPKVSYRTFAFSNGGEACFSGFDNRKIKISGTISGEGSNSGSGSTSVVMGNNSSFYNKIRTGKNRIKIKRANGSNESIFCIYNSSFGLTEGIGSGAVSVSLDGEEGSSNSFSQ